MSLIQMHRSPCRFAAWLGLFAILLLFIAPVISKSLASSFGNRSGMTEIHHAMQMTHLNAERDLPEGETGPEPAMQHAAHAKASPATAMADMTPAEHARMMLYHPMSMMDDNACGYCVLLAHLPLDLNSLPPLWSALQAAKPPALPLLQRFIPQVVTHFFHPRAPPLAQ